MLNQYQNIIIIVLAGFSLILFIWNISLHLGIRKVKQALKILFQGNRATQLEDIILSNNVKLNNLDKDIKDLYEITNKIHFLAHKGIHNVGVVRFNPFKDLGGDQSFSVALLDGEINGVTISSLYSRDGTRVYAKAISSGQSLKYPLTEEEKKAIAIASIAKNNKEKKKSI